MPKILLVEGSQKSASNVARLITKNLKVKLLQTDLKSEALNILKRQVVDLIVLDVQLSQINGFEFCEQVHLLELSRNTPILLISSLEGDACPEVKALSLDPEDIYSLPAPGSNLIAWLHILLKLQARIGNPPAVSGRTGKTSDTITVEDYQNVLNDQPEKGQPYFGDIGEFIGALAHTVRNPLTGISTNVQFMQMVYADSNAQKEIYSDIMEAVHRLDLLFRDLVDYIRPLELHKEKTDLNELLKAAIKSFHKVIQNRKLKISENYDDNLPRMELDRGRFQRALTGILEYCIFETSEKSAIELGSYQEQEIIYLYMKTIILDLNPQRFETLFAPSTSLKRTATGLGLAFVKRILNEHRLSLQVDLGKDGLTKFVISIPHPQQDDA